MLIISWVRFWWFCVWVIHSYVVLSWASERCHHVRRRHFQHNSRLKLFIKYAWHYMRVHGTTVICRRFERYMIWTTWSIDTIGQLKTIFSLVIRGKPCRRLWLDLEKHPVPVNRSEFFRTWSVNCKSQGLLKPYCFFLKRLIWDKKVRQLVMRCPFKDLAKSSNNRFGSVNFWIRLGTLFKNSSNSAMQISKLP